jgi:hypothetical protein
VLTHWLGVTETSFDHLWQLVLITNLTTLLPLPLLFLLPTTTSQSVSKSEGQSGDQSRVETARTDGAFQPAETPTVPTAFLTPTATGYSVAVGEPGPDRLGQRE